MKSTKKEREEERKGEGEEEIGEGRGRVERRGGGEGARNVQFVDFIFPHRIQVLLNNFRAELGLLGIKLVK